jgi:predicted nucleic acid-binding protein
MRVCLIDTGPLVAYLHRKDPMHVPISEFLDNFRGQLATTGAVITEVMYFISDSPHGPISFGKFLLAAGIRVAESSQPEQVLAAAELMNRYSDTPMDFADATLVMLAEQLGTTEILTVDRRGFSTYRTNKGKEFKLVGNL